MTAAPGLMALLAPPGAAAFDARDTGQPAFLFPAEAMLVASAVEKRRREFALGRVCARAALARLGVEPAPILRAGRGAPAWPEGMTGSITHTRGYAAAMAAPAARYAGIGIDAERENAVGAELEDRLFTPSERARLDAAGQGRAALATLLFSAKEASFKAAGARIGLRLSFPDFEITPTGDTFAATVTGADIVIAGRHMARDGLVATAAWLMA